MRITAAYITLILLWSTTPLAIKWSGEGPGFIFAVSARMTIGAVCMLILLPFMRQGLPLHSKALQTYGAVALQIYGAMMTVYWAAQFIPSGWISVIFGLTPFITAIIAAIWLGERSLTPGKIFSYCLGVGGLAVMFMSAIQFGHESVQGIIRVLAASFLQSFSAVWVKSINAKIKAVSQVTGGLLLSLPAYLLTWYYFDQGQWPTAISATNLAAILYLGLIATTIGFALYYYVLTQLSATRVALVTLVSPVLALLLGHFVNHEPLTLKIAFGTALILTALLLHSFFDRRKPQKSFKK